MTAYQRAQVVRMLKARVMPGDQIAKVVGVTAKDVEKLAASLPKEAPTKTGAVRPRDVSIPTWRTRCNYCVAKLMGRTPTAAAKERWRYARDLKTRKAPCGPDCVKAQVATPAPAPAPAKAKAATKAPVKVPVKAKSKDVRALDAIARAKLRAAKRTERDARVTEKRLAAELHELEDVMTAQISFVRDELKSLRAHIDAAHIAIGGMKADIAGLKRDRDAVPAPIVQPVPVQPSVDPVVLQEPGLSTSTDGTAPAFEPSSFALPTDEVARMGGYKSSEQVAQAVMSVEGTGPSEQPATVATAAGPLVTESAIVGDLETPAQFHVNGA